MTAIQSMRQMFFASVAGSSLIMAAAPSLAYNPESSEADYNSANAIELPDFKTLSGDITDLVYDRSMRLNSSNIEGYLFLHIQYALTIIADNKSRGIHDADTIMEDVRRLMAMDKAPSRLNSFLTGELKDSAFKLNHIASTIHSGHVLIPEHRMIIEAAMEKIVADAFENDEPDYKLSIDNALQDYIKSLDPHTALMRAEDVIALFDFQKAVYGGIGVLIEYDHDKDAPLPENPVYRQGILIEELTDPEAPSALAGIQEGDIITHVDGVAMAGLTEAHALSALKGEEGSQVELLVHRFDTAEPISISITREILPERIVQSKIVAENIGYIAISSFNNQTDPQLDRAIQALEPDVEGYILDLRNNIGGSVIQASKVINAFVSPAPEYITFKDRSDAMRDARALEILRALPGHEGRDFTVLTDDMKDLLHASEWSEIIENLPEPNEAEKALIDGNISISYGNQNGREAKYHINIVTKTHKPLVILTNRNTASSAELVTVALQEFGRATVIGTQTFGKGVSQASYFHDVDKDGVNDYGIKITDHYLYAGPYEGVSIHNEGLAPNILVSDNFTQWKDGAKRHSDYENALPAPADANNYVRSTAICNPKEGDIIIAPFNNASAEDAGILCAIEFFKGDEVDHVTIDTIQPQMAELKSQLEPQF